jgi:hypothetical protein
MAVSLPGVPDEDPAADVPRPFDRSSLEQSLAEVLLAADPERATARPDPAAAPDDVTVPTAILPTAVPPSAVPPSAGPPAASPSEGRAAGAGRPDPFRAAGSVNHVGLRLPTPPPPAGVGPVAPGAPGGTLEPGAAEPAVAADPPGGALRPVAAIPPNLRLLAPPPDVAADGAAVGRRAADGTAPDGTAPDGTAANWTATPVGIAPDDPAAVASGRAVSAGSVRAGAGDDVAPVAPWRPEDDDILPQRRGRRRRGH